MKTIKVFLIAAGVLAVIGGLFWQFFLRGQVEYAQLATAYTAKQVCSCRFVAAREMASCQNDFTENVSAVKLTEGSDAAGEFIKASVLWGMVSAKAEHVDGMGCRVVRE